VAPGKTYPEPIVAHEAARLRALVALAKNKIREQLSGVWTLQPRTVSGNQLWLTLCNVNDGAYFARDQRLWSAMR
jgi:hypothetical protein